MYACVCVCVYRYVCICRPLYCMAIMIIVTIYSVCSFIQILSVTV